MTEKFTQDPELNELLNEVYVAAVEKVFKRLPLFLLQLNAKTYHLVKLKDEFYTTHPNLVAHKKLVSQAVARMERTDPTLTPEELLAKAAIVVNTSLEAREELNVRQTDALLEETGRGLKEASVAIDPFGSGLEEGSQFDSSPTPATDRPVTGNSDDSGDGVGSI